jgi:arylsulfatase A-like enzyme
MPRLQVVLLGIVAGLGGLAGCGGEARGEAPIVVLVLADTLRRDSLSCYGGEFPTPHMDELARRGVRFEQAISSSGWTLPAAASILTGVSPSVHQARGKHTRLTPISPDVETVAERLRAGGVRTLAFTNAAFVNPLLGLTRGFERESHRHAYNQDVRRAGETLAAAFAELARDDGRPTFCFVHLFDAHLDYDPPGEFATRYTEGLTDARRPLGFPDCSHVPPGEPEPGVSAEHVRKVRAAYEAEVAYVDHELGKFLAGLEERGDLERTTVILTADHGEEFWEHGAFEHGHSLYDELVRVPLVIAPAQGRAGEVCDVPVRTLDLAPTLCELFGVEGGGEYEGESLLAALRGETVEPRTALAEGTLYGSDKVALRNERYKVVLDRHPRAKRPIEVYDWRADPREQVDLTQQEPELARELQRELEARLAALESVARGKRPGEVQDLSPAKREEYLRQIESLGYGGD